VSRAAPHTSSRVLDFAWPVRRHLALSPFRSFAACSEPPLATTFFAAARVFAADTPDAGAGAARCVTAGAYPLAQLTSSSPSAPSDVRRLPQTLRPKDYGRSRRHSELPRFPCLTVIFEIPPIRLEILHFRAERRHGSLSALLCGASCPRWAWQPDRTDADRRGWCCPVRGRTVCRGTSSIGRARVGLVSCVAECAVIGTECLSAMCGASQVRADARIADPGPCALPTAHMGAASITH
jgi:hypothetical protein